ncbi:MAG TPA: hypothetical protein VES67_15795 [Vicinamibacterales bacterium]|nr:hypothetical protein [Vicinamibacterales bacterium]
MTRSSGLISILAAAALCFLAADTSQAQPPPAGQTTTPARAGSRLRVFLDCDSCFADYLREEIKWVDFVRQREDADVHLLSSSQETGGGGRQVVLRFVGVGRFQGIDHELRSISLSADTEDTRRRGVLRTVSVGLLAYLAREGLPSDIKLAIEAAESDEPPAGSRDPWNFWVFGVNGSSDINAEESQRDWSVDFGLSADRVTERWKMSFGASFDHSQERFNLDEEDEEPLEVTRRERRVEWFVAKSLGEHWSAGLDGNVRTSTFGNLEVSATAAPTVEFSVFPYSQYATRQLRVQYSLGVAHSSYNEITLFGKLRETLPGHELSLTLEQRQPWGTLEARAQWSQYLHDLSKYRLEAGGDLSLRLARGLSLNVEGSASRVRDQLSLPLRGATPEEVLLRLRDLQSGYEVSFDIGLSYRFGSIFNNIVNPRFGR